MKTITHTACMVLLPLGLGESLGMAVVEDPNRADLDANLEARHRSAVKH